VVRLPAEAEGFSLFRSFQTGYGGYLYKIGTGDFLPGGKTVGA